MDKDDLIEKIYTRIDTLQGREVDELKFGAIQLDADGKILQYNQYEQQLAGFAAKDVVGKNFFKDVAPCTDVKEFHGKFKEGVLKKNLQTKFRYRFVFKDRPPRNVLISMYYSSISQSTWIFVQAV